MLKGYTNEFTNESNDADPVAEIKISVAAFTLNDWKQNTYNFIGKL